MTFADDMRAEDERLRRRVVHHTRPRGPMSLQEAMALCQQMEPPSMIVSKDDPILARIKAGEPQHDHHVKARQEWTFRRRTGLMSLHGPMVVATGN